MNSMNGYLRRTVLVLTTVFGLGACGPISAFSNVRDASIEIEKAKAVGADKLAIYQFVSAQQYLAKAREEQGYADYQIAVDMAKKATVFAQKAQKVALAKGKAKAEGKVDSPKTGRPARPKVVRPQPRIVKPATKIAPRPVATPKPVPVKQKITPAGGQ